MNSLWTLFCLTALALLLACTPQERFWSRASSGADAFERTSTSCTQQASGQAQQEQESASSGALGSSGGGYGSPDQRATPNSENERRRFERRVRYFYGLCMEARGWTSNASGDGFRGL